MIVTTHSETGIVFITGIVIGYMTCMVIDWLHEYREKRRLNNSKPKVDQESTIKSDNEYPRVYDQPKRRTMWD